MTMKIKILALAVAAVAAIGAVATLNFPRLRFTVHVVDEDGKPVSGVTATFVLNEDSSTLDKTTDVAATTDENGNLTVEGYSQYGTVSYRKAFTKDGYYTSGVNLPSFNHEVKDHEWQPWDQTFTTVLRKIGNPIPMYVRKFGGAIPSAINEPCGFDLEEGDWVAPYGEGKVADFIVTITYLKYTDYNNNEVTATITFSNDGDGIQEVHLSKEFSNSKFAWPREAPETGYQPNFDMHHLWSMSGHDTVMTDTLKGVDGYFFRVRTVRQGDKIVSALYGKIIGGIGIGPNEGKNGYTGFTYYLNPTPNDQNMEWDPKKNLAPTPKDPALQVHAP